MSRHKMKGYELSLSERHECKVQELRHERKSEGHRLDGLKKVLQTRLPPDPTQAGKFDPHRSSMVPARS